MIIATQAELFDPETHAHIARMVAFAQSQTARDEAMAQVERNAGEEFRSKAKSFVLTYLAEHGESSGEDVTDACIAAGIEPHDTRAFGPVCFALSRAGQIEKAGFCQRRKGHATAGGIVWRLSH